MTHVCAGGNHHWCLRLYFQSFSNIQPEISSQKQVALKKLIKSVLPTLIFVFCYANQIIYFLGLRVRRRSTDYMKQLKQLQEEGNSAIGFIFYAWYTKCRYAEG